MGKDSDIKIIFKDKEINKIFYVLIEKNALEFDWLINWLGFEWESSEEAEEIFSRLEKASVKHFKPEHEIITIDLNDNNNYLQDCLLVVNCSIEKKVIYNIECVKNGSIQSRLTALKEKF